MKLVRYLDAQNTPQLGVHQGTDVYPVQGYTNVQELMHKEFSALQQLPLGSAVPLASVRLLAPIQPERNIICVGWNYLKHYTESIGKREGQEQDLPEQPTLFTKATTSLAHPGQTLPLHSSLTQRLDWEVELAVIIGKAGRDITEQEALNYVFGYTIANDISARDLQRAHGGQWFKGKSLDGTCPLGPFILTADELPNPQALDIACLLNGEVMQASNTERQIFSVAKVIAEVSAGMTLLPGDIILTGTPDGIGNARTPPIFIKVGDVIECRIQGLGALINDFQDQPAATFSS